MRKVLMVLLTVPFFFLQCCTEEAKTENEKVRDGVFVHITHGSDDVHRLLMGLQMAVKMADTKDVLVYFDINGIEAVLKGAEDYSLSHFPSSLTQIKELFSKGVTLMACPGCLKAAGKTENDLMEGIKIAEKETFFGFTKGRILSLDY